MPEEAQEVNITVAAPESQPEPEIVPVVIESQATSQDSERRTEDVQTALEILRTAQEAQTANFNQWLQMVQERVSTVLERLETATENYEVRNQAIDRLASDLVGAVDHVGIATQVLTELADEARIARQS